MQAENHLLGSGVDAAAMFARETGVMPEVTDNGTLNGNFGVNYNLLPKLRKLVAIPDTPVTSSVMPKLEEFRIRPVWAFFQDGGNQIRLSETWDFVFTGFVQMARRYWEDNQQSAALVTAWTRALPDEAATIGLAVAPFVGALAASVGGRALTPEDVIRFLPSKSGGVR